MPLNPRHGLYDAETQTLHHWFGGSWHETRPAAYTLMAVAQHALGATDVRDVWVGNAPADWWTAESRDIFLVPVANNRARAASYDGASGDVYLHQWGAPPWPGATHPDPPLVLRAYDHLSRVLRRPFGFTPGALGLDILRDTARKHPEWFKPETLPIALHHPRQQWCRAPRPDDGRYIHCYDMRAAFLGAARSLRFPTGAAMHLQDPRLLFGPLGLATAEHAAAVDLTAALRNPGPLRKHGWHVQSVYRGALVAGQHPEVRDAYVYSQRHEALRDWADTLSAAARTFRGALDTPAAHLAMAVWKDIYRAAIGRLAAPTFGQARWYFLPFWHAMIEGEVLRRMWTVACPTNRFPALALLTDEVLLTSPDPDPAIALALCGEAPGQFLHRWTCEGFPPDALAVAKAGNAVALRDACKERAA